MLPRPAPRHHLLSDLGRPGWVLVTGVLLGLSFPPFPFYGLALIALVPLLARWSRLPSMVVLFRETYSAFLIFAAFSGYWVLFHADALKALLLGLGLLLLPLLFTLPVLGSSLVLRRFGLPAGLLALVSGWLAVEHLLTQGPVPMPWLLVGHTQANALLFNQFADISGVAGLTLWVWLVNVMVFVFLRAPSLTARFALGLAVLMLALAPIGYRGWRLSSLPAPSDTASVMVAQPALSATAWSEVANLDRVQALAELSDRALGPIPVNLGLRPSSRPDLMIWPEAALPVFPEGRLQQTLYDRLQDWTSRRHIALLTGAVTRFDTAPALTVEPFLAQQAALRSPYYNSALLFDTQRTTQQYDKIRMLPVADRVPFTGWLPGQTLGVTRSFGTGAEHTVFRVGHRRFSSLIAYEVFFGEHAREMVHEGAEFLTVLANTGWWSYAPAYGQFQALARLRAIETRRSVVIASVTGGSGVILPDGSMPESAGWMTPEVVKATIPLHVMYSTYVARGDVIYPLGSFIAALLFMAWGGCRLFYPVPKGIRIAPAPKRLFDLDDRQPVF